MSIFTSNTKKPGVNATKSLAPLSKSQAKAKLPQTAAKHGAGRPIQTKGAGYRGDGGPDNTRTAPPSRPANQDRSKPKTGPA